MGTNRVNLPIDATGAMAAGVTNERMAGDADTFRLTKRASVFLESEACGPIISAGAGASVQKNRSLQGTVGTLRKILQMPRRRMADTVRTAVVFLCTRDPEVQRGGVMLTQ